MKDKIFKNSMRNQVMDLDWGFIILKEAISGKKREFYSYSDAIEWMDDIVENADEYQFEIVDLK